MTVDYDVTPEDLTAWFTYAHSTPAAVAIKRRDYAGSVGGAAVVGVGATLLVLRQGDWTLTALIIAVAAACVGFAMLYVRALSRHGGRLYKTLFGRMAVGPFVLALSADAIRERGRIAVRRRWSGLEAVFETPNHVFLSLGWLGAIVLPKRCLRDTAQLTELRETIMAYGGAHRRIVWHGAPEAPHNHELKRTNLRCP